MTGEALPYFLGLPLVGGARNYSRADAAVAEACVALLAAFAKTGEPAPARADERHADLVAWPRYELNTQQYLSIGRASQPFYYTVQSKGGTRTYVPRAHEFMCRIEAAGEESLSGAQVGAVAAPDPAAAPARCGAAAPPVPRDAPRHVRRSVASVTFYLTPYVLY